MNQKTKPKENRDPTKEKKTNNLTLKTEICPFCFNKGKENNYSYKKNNSHMKVINSF